MAQNLIGVPIVETGIEYPTSTGLITLTADDLTAIVESQQDPAIVAPRLKLGHNDTRFNNMDGEPAFGVAKNLRLEHAGNTVVCDYYGVPDWLASVLPTAYPNRSIEGNWDVETVTGHKWRFVVTDVALLGVVWPGISTLDDLEIALSDSGPEGVTMAQTSTVAEVSWLDFKNTLEAASTNVEDVRREFYDSFATQDEDRYFWWIRALLLNPNELIVDDDEGGLYRIPFSMGKDDVSFSDPIPVKIEYVDQPAQAASVAGAFVAASFQDSSESRPEQRSKDRVATVNAAINLDRLRQRLSLPADATEDDINVALTQEENPPAGTDPAPADSSQSGTVSEGSGEENEPTPDPPAEGTAASAANAGAVLVDKDVFATLQRDAAMGRQAFERQRITDRDTFLHAAVTNGKFAPARLQHWQNAWEKDPEGTKAAVDSLAAGLIPVGQVGIVSNEEGDTGPAYPAQLFPELQRRRQATSTIQQES